MRRSKEDDGAADPSTVPSRNEARRGRSVGSGAALGRCKSYWEFGGGPKGGMVFALANNVGLRILDLLQISEDLQVTELTA